MNSSTLLDRFCLWFEGEFDNWEQASSNPSSWAHIFLVHKKIGDRKFYTTSRYNYSNTPYREQEVTIEEDHGILLSTIPFATYTSLTMVTILLVDRLLDAFTRTNHLKVKQNFLMENTTHGTKDIGDLQTDFLLFVRSYK